MEFQNRLDFGEDICKDIAEKKRILGNEEYKEKNYQAALKSYSEAIILCPDTAAYYGNRSACHMMLLNYNNALSDARKAVTLDPKYEKGHIRVVKCCLALGDTTATEQAIKYLLRYFPKCNVHDEVQALEELKKLEAKINTNMSNKLYRSALFYLESALKISPASMKYRLGKAECLVLLGRSSEALDIALSAMKMDPSSAEAVYVRGLCLYYTDFLDKAIIHFERALHLDPDHQKAKDIRYKAKLLRDFKETGNYLYLSEKYVESLAAYSNALKADPTNVAVNAKIYYNRALIHSKLGTWNDTVKECSSALELNGNYVKALLLRARGYKELDRHDKCVSDLEAALRLDKSVEIKRLLREAKLALKRSKRKDYYKILGLPPNADMEDIKKAYRKKALVHHPDRHASKSEEERKAEEIIFKEIGEAYAVLSDQSQKKKYDSSGDMNDGESDFDASNVFGSFIFNDGDIQFRFY